MHGHLLAKMDSRKEAYEQAGTTFYGVTPPPFLIFKEPFCACVVRKVFRDFENEEYVVFYLLSGQS